MCPERDALFVELRNLKFDIVDAAICVELVPYARQTATSIFNATQAHLQQNCPQMIYKPSNLDVDLNQHLDLLCSLVPPVEYHDGPTVRATSLASILNVGWAALLTRLRSIPPGVGTSGDVDARRMERLHDLLIKAVELAEARLLWDEHR